MPVAALSIRARKAVNDCGFGNFEIRQSKDSFRYGAFASWPWPPTPRFNRLAQNLIRLGPYGASHGHDRLWPDSAAEELRPVLICHEGLYDCQGLIVAGFSGLIVQGNTGIIGNDDPLLSIGDVNLH